MTDVSDTETTPNFARNRDLTDMAYDSGWHHAKIGLQRSNRYQKKTLRAAYIDGWNAYRAHRATIQT